MSSVPGAEKGSANAMQAATSSSRASNGRPSAVARSQPCTTTSFRATEAAMGPGISIPPAAVSPS